MATHSSTLALKIPRTEGAWQAAVHGAAKSRTRLHFHFSLSCIGEGNGNPLQCSCLENPRDGGAWWAAVYGVTESDMTEATQQQQQACEQTCETINNQDRKHIHPPNLSFLLYFCNVFFNPLSSFISRKQLTRFLSSQISLHFLEFVEMDFIACTYFGCEGMDSFQILS